MEFPTTLYRCPGQHQCPGGTFSYAGAKDAAEFCALIAAGWFATMPEAMAGKANATAAVELDPDEPLPEPEPEATEAPTSAPEQAPVSDVDKLDGAKDRDALKAEATALGLEYPKNVPTDRLIEMIAQAKAGA